MTMNDQSQQALFHSILVTVVGQAFSAAGYTLYESPMKWAMGQYRFVKDANGGPDDNGNSDAQHVIEFQHLAYRDTEWSSGMPSRFRVMLFRADGESRTLSALVVEDFGVSILPDADHWWGFRTTDDLGKALAEAGHLIIGYGMPWLSGELTPPAK